MFRAEGPALLHEGYHPADARVETAGRRIRHRTNPSAASVCTKASHCAAASSGVPVKGCRPPAPVTGSEPGERGEVGGVGGGVAGRLRGVRRDGRVQGVGHGVPEKDGTDDRGPKKRGAGPRRSRRRRSARRRSSGAAGSDSGPDRPLAVITRSGTNRYALHTVSFLLGRGS
ncbi:hypothetical protein JCM4914_58860 [Streptomyces platensis subsp. malvinus]